MENQKEITLKINRDEIYFNCKGYSEEFINTIGDIINQRRQSLECKNDKLLQAAQKIAGCEVPVKRIQATVDAPVVKAVLDDFYGEGASGKTAKQEDLKENLNNNGSALEHSSDDPLKSVIGKTKAGKSGKTTNKFKNKRDEMFADIKKGIGKDEFVKKYEASYQTFQRYKKKVMSELKGGLPTKNKAIKQAAIKHSSECKKTGFSSTPISEDDRIKIAEDIKLGLYSRQILKKYHINIIAYSEIKKSIGTDKKNSANFKDDPEVIKKRIAYANGPESGTQDLTEGAKKSLTLKAHRNYLKQNRENIIADIKAGMTAEECRKKWGISIKSYGQYKNSYERIIGKDLKDSGRPMTPEERAAWLNSMNGKEEDVRLKTGDFNFLGDGKNHTRGTGSRVSI